MFPTPLFGAGEVRIKMLSPVVVYSTFESPDGKKKTYYYSPSEREFSLLISKNLRNKYKAFYGKDFDGEIIVSPEGVRAHHQQITLFKGTVIKGWMGKYLLKGKPELLRFAYDVGIGSKNSQGFGMWAVDRRRGGCM